MNLELSDLESNTIFSILLIAIFSFVVGLMFFLDVDQSIMIVVMAIIVLLVPTMLFRSSFRKAAIERRRLYRSAKEHLDMLGKGGKPSFREKLSLIDYIKKENEIIKYALGIKGIEYLQEVKEYPGVQNSSWYNTAVRDPDDYVGEIYMRLKNLKKAAEREQGERGRV